ncbi:Helicase [Gracilaria domingensis]|nr:Helicase [Gracilaria domingensis]
MYANRLARPYIFIPTSQTERLRISGTFQHNPPLNTILLSKVGDTSIDIPEANVLIQVGSHYGSRRQEAQRLGRIVRSKPRAGQNFNAFFYSLMSTNTQEMFYPSKRQQFLIDQGYEFKVTTHLEEQLELFAKVLSDDGTEAAEHLDVDEEVRAQAGNGRDGGYGRMVHKRPNSMGALTGARGTRYNEFDKRRDSAQANLPKRKNRYTDRRLLKNLRYLPRSDPAS